MIYFARQELVEGQIFNFPGLKFKSKSLYNEFVDSRKTDPRVRSLALELGFFANLIGSSLEITQIGRSKRSQIKIYGFDKKSGHREKPSRAIDFSTKNLPKKIIDKLIEHFNFYLDLGYHYSLIYHDVGAGYHFHLQVPHTKYNKILWDKE
jgi:hypothetical protein